MTVDTDRKYFAVKRNGSGNSGQAMLELLVLLFGLMLLIVGLVVLSAVEGAENAHLLRNKYTAEMAARSSGSEVIDSGEIHAWRRHSLELYRNSADIVIPFTRQDRQTGGYGSLEGVNHRLHNRQDSAAVNYDYRYFDMGDFQQYGRRVDSVAEDDAMHAARLVSRNAAEAEAGRNSDESVTVSIRNILSGVFRELFGKIPDPADNITNRVFMPLQEETGL